MWQYFVSDFFVKVTDLICRRYLCVLLFLHLVLHCTNQEGSESKKMVIMVLDKVNSFDLGTFLITGCLKHVILCDILMYTVSRLTCMSR